ncbi:hypothetical protein L204_103888 [Cryptococcus depauperatus]
MSYQKTNLNDISVMPTGVQGSYPGVQNVSESSVHQPENVSATIRKFIGRTGVPNERGYEHVINDNARDVVEGEPGVIESSDLAPLGHEIIAEDPGLMTGTAAMAKNIYSSLTDNH